MAFLLSQALTALAALFIAAPSASANDVVSVFDVRKSLPLDPSEPVFHDFYLNAGPEAGLKKGMYVSVVRKTPVHDPLGNKAQGTLSVEVAKVQIIHVERNISVARLAVDFGSEDRPVLEFEAIMIGDELDLSTVSMDAPKERKKERKRWSASADAPVPAPAPEASTQLPAAASVPVGGAVPVQIAPVAPNVPAKEVENPATGAAAPAPPSAVENPSRPAPVPGMVRGDDNVHT